MVQRTLGFLLPWVLLTAFSVVPPHLWTCPLSLSVLAYLTFKPRRDKGSVWSAGGCCLLWQSIVQLPLLSISVDGIHLQKRGWISWFDLDNSPKNVYPETRRLHLPLISVWVLLDKYCPMLYFAMLSVACSTNKFSLTPFFLSPWCPVSQILLNLSPKHYQICSLLSLPASTTLARATATFARTITVSSLLPISWS